jgi:predicted dehydrogenase
VRICIIGSSGHHGYALDAIKNDSDCQLVGIAPGSEGENIDGLQEKISRIGLQAPVYEDYRAMLDELKPDIAVVNCYFGDHAKVALEVLKRKIHIFIEKPIATTLEDLELVKKEYENSGVHLAAMMGIRYKSHFLTAWEAIKQGSIGKVRLMNAQKSYKLGSRSEFYKHRESYGGTIPWVGSHAIDWMYWLSGEKFVSVYASHSKQYNRDHGDLEVTALCHFTFTNEVFGGVNIDYLRPATAPTHDDDRIRIAGTEGVIEVRGGKVYLINNEAEGEQELPLLPEKNIFADFLRQVRGEGKCMVSAEDSFAVTEACLKARLSADKKEVVYF